MSLEIAALAAIVDSFKPPTPEARQQLFSRLIEIRRNYVSARERREQWGTLREHRQRLKEAATSARHLKDLAAIGSRKPARFGIFDLAATEADRLRGNLDPLRAAEAHDGSEQKEILGHIWYPVFRLWLACGNRLGKARRGAVYTVLRQIHAVFKLAEPSGETVKKAIEEFHKTEIAFGQEWEKFLGPVLARGTLDGLARGPLDGLGGALRQYFEPTLEAPLPDEMLQAVDAVEQATRRR
jgi:hypothetical protein